MAFFLGRPHLFSILKHLISRGELLSTRPDSARPRQRAAQFHPGGFENFGINSAAPAGFNVIEETVRLARLPFVVWRKLYRPTLSCAVQFTKSTTLSVLIFSGPFLVASSCPPSPFYSPVSRIRNLRHVRARLVGSAGSFYVCVCVRSCACAASDSFHLRNRPQVIRG